MNNAQGIQLDPKAQLIGIARCSESEPFCTAVQRRDNGDIVLANHVGAQFVIPAAEVVDVVWYLCEGAE
jgi:hypothetical protein